MNGAPQCRFAPRADRADRLPTLKKVNEWFQVFDDLLCGFSWGWPFSERLLVSARRAPALQRTLTLLPTRRRPRFQTLRRPTPRTKTCPRGSRRRKSKLRLSPIPSRRQRKIRSRRPQEPLPLPHLQAAPRKAAPAHRRNSPTPRRPSARRASRRSRSRSISASSA